MLENGLYEQVINEKISGELAGVEARRKATEPIDEAEAPVVLAQYLSEIVLRGLRRVGEGKDGMAAQIALVNRLVEVIRERVDGGERIGAGGQAGAGKHISTRKRDSAGEFAGLSVEEQARQLLALLPEKDPSLAAGKSASDLVRPETSVAHSSLFTGAACEPQLGSELKKEIQTADRIDMLVSFIKWSGLRLIIEDLRAFAERGGELRIITTSYMGATDVKAVEELRKLPGARIKVSYDTERTRLHAKAYIFYRDTGFTTAYIGSSNLSHAAMSSGLEWNIKAARRDLPETIDKISAAFESYWNSREFEYYDEGQRERLARALSAEHFHGEMAQEVYTIDIRPYSYQQEILDRLEAERRIRGYSFLGKAQYVSHTGSNPMNILFRMEHPIPAQFMRKTNKMLVG